jgi:formyl-CoA transferase
VGVPIADLAAGLYLAIGILVALHERDRSGEGQWVQTSLLEAMIAMLDFQAARWTIDGDVPGPEGNHHPTSVPMGCFATADGWVNVAGPSGRLYRSFCEVIGMPELLDDPRFATGALRSANRLELNGLIGDRLRTGTTADWVARFTEAGVPAGPVNRIDEAMREPQVRHLAMEAPVRHPVLGELSLVRNAVTLSRGPDSVRGPSPEAGQHTDEVLREIGVSDAELADLRARGVT